VEYDARQLSMRLSFSCSLHPEHALLYHPVSPPPRSSSVNKTVSSPDATLPTSSSSPNSSFRAITSPSDAYFCDAVISPYCMSHDLNKHLRPVYACSHCNYRLCLPCYRWYLLDSFSRLRASLSYEAADAKVEALMREWRRSRGEDQRAITNSDVMARKEGQWLSNRRQGWYIAGASAVLAVALINAMLTLPDNGVAAGPLLNVVLILIAALCVALAASSLCNFVVSSQRRCAAHYRAIDALYLDPTLAFFFQTVKPSPLPLSAITPKQRDRISDIYSHQVAVRTTQRNATSYSLLAVLLLFAASGLFVAGASYLFISVLCSLSMYQFESACEVRSGVPVAVLLFAVVVWTLWVQVVSRAWRWLLRVKRRVEMHRREERQRTKWQRRE
jgi:hypothetical protein